jgi:excinuclease UvrABC helicase subunit UvrB
MENASKNPNVIPNDIASELKTNSNILTDRNKIDLSKIQDMTEEYSVDSPEDNGFSPAEAYSNFLRDHNPNNKPFKLMLTDSNSTFSLLS